jgi:hypothetical protein
MLLGAVVRDVLLGVFGLIGALPADPTVRAELVAVTGAALLPAGLLATGLGFYFARRTPPVVDVEVRVPGLDPRLVGLRIVQISDIHVGPTIKRARIARMVAEIDALDADVVAITGDLVDGSVASLREHTAPIAELRAHARVRRQRADHSEDAQEHIASEGPEQHERHEAHQRQAHPGHVIGQGRLQQEPPEERRGDRQRRQRERGPGGRGGGAGQAEPPDHLQAHVGVRAGDDRQGHGKEHEEGGGRFLHAETMPEIPGGRTGHGVSASRTPPSCA